jgi:hypothetical protein
MPERPRSSLKETLLTKEEEIVQAMVADDTETNP